jgi:hypothetical protein
MSLVCKKSGSFLLENLWVYNGKIAGICEINSIVELTKIVVKN